VLLVQCVDVSEKKRGRFVTRVKGLDSKFRMSQHMHAGTIKLGEKQVFKT